MDEDQVLELNAVPEIYADGIGRIVPCGPNVKLQLWTWTELSGIMQRIAVATVIRPFDTLVLTQDEVMRRVRVARERILQSGVWHVVWLTAFAYDEWVPMLPMALGPLH